MTVIQRVKSTFEKALKNRFLRNVGWLGGSDLFVRISYLATTVTLARFLTSYDYGLAAIVMTVHEIMQVFTRIGIGAKVVQSTQEDFDVLCNSAYYLNWLVFIGLFVAQCFMAFVIAGFYKDSRLILPICALAAATLLVPISSIQASLTSRENRLKVFAITNSLQFTTSNLLAIVFAFMGLGLWAIVLPKVLGTPIWVYMHYRQNPWRPTMGFTTQYWGEILQFGRNVLGVQFLKTARNYVDYLLVGRFVGIEQLGIYYFAFNAGLGISMSIINAINGALFPHLCAERSDWEKFRQQYLKSVKTIALLLVPIVLLQASLAPIYVPIIFGQKWAVAVPVLMVICLSAIPRPFSDAAANLVTSVGRPDIDLRWNVLFTGLFTAALLVGVQWQAMGVAIAVLLSHWIFLPLYAVWASRYVFTKLRPASEALGGAGG